MIQLNKVEIEGFRSIVNPLIFNLNRPGLNLIKGVNGAGKTTVFEALIWALYGVNLKETNQDALASWEEVRPSNWRGTRVMVNLNIGEDHYCIIRHLSYKGETNGLKGGDSLMIWVDDSQLYPGINKDETQEKIDKLIGADSKIFMNSVMFAQRSARLITQDNKDKRALFEQLFDVEWVNIAKRKAEVGYSEKTREVQEEQRKADTLDVQIGMLEQDYKKDEQILNDWSFNHGAHIDRLMENIKIYQGQIAQAIEKKAQIVIPEYNEKEHNDVEVQFKAAYEIQQTGLSLIQSLQNDLKDLNYIQKGDEMTRTWFIEDNRSNQTAIDKAKQTVKDAQIKGLCPVCHQPLKAKQTGLVEKAYSTGSYEQKIKQNTEGLDKLSIKLDKRIGDINFKQGQLKKAEKTNADNLNAYTEIKAKYEALNAIEAKVIEGGDMMEAWDKKISNNELLMEKEKENLTLLQAEKAPKIDLKAQKDTITSKTVELTTIQNHITDLMFQTSIIKWWIEKGFGAGGIKAFIFNAMLAQLNENTRKYGERLGVSLEFKIDLTKASKPFTTICSLGTKLNKDYKEVSGGEKQRLDIVLIFAMYDLISINTNINLLIMDEVFEGLDEDGENAVFDLIRMKADEGRSVYVITHSAVLDSLYANTIYLNNSNLTTEILN